MSAASKTINTTGRRKRSIARIRMKSGQGNIVVNHRPIEEYFKLDTAKMKINQPFDLTSTNGSYDVYVNVVGGGTTGQAEAVRHGISRALVAANPEFRGVLKKNGLLTRDPREVERKKYGQPGARKRYQFSKR
ncbi:MAG: 30S ribosomal protein S9 [Deltaproteobacteria bacterium]|nr:30S ribosomal protein S9 [Deltaproteobacteria bacterium]